MSTTTAAQNSFNTRSARQSWARRLDTRQARMYADIRTVADAAEETDALRAVAPEKSYRDLADDFARMGARAQRAGDAEKLRVWRLMWRAANGRAVERGQ